MRYKATLITTLFAILLCAFNYTGYDPHNLFFFMFSIPVWLVNLFADIHQVSVLLMYILTIITWALLGFAIDFLVAKQRKQQSSK
ncbi:hypothetical protein ACFSTH_10310 [Paenibacillus yanchengensis]|uniref:DUF3311 domain-containing protein n=1 Tax=Paenibacillus yanchengensis TaxID=2035833 RepID=A0ABW4YNN5_9BACL